MMYIHEGYFETSKYITSQEVRDLVSDLPADSTSEEIATFVVDIINNYQDRENTEPAQIVSVSSYKVRGETVDLLDANHYVVLYDGYYYDYSADEFSNSFITKINLPVVQRVLSSVSQVTNSNSTLRDYSMIRNM